MRSALPEILRKKLWPFILEIERYIVKRLPVNLFTSGTQMALFCAEILNQIFHGACHGSAGSRRASRLQEEDSTDSSGHSEVARRIYSP